VGVGYCILLVKDWENAAMHGALDFFVVFAFYLSLFLFEKGIRQGGEVGVSFVSRVTTIPRHAFLRYDFHEVYDSWLARHTFARSWLGLGVLIGNG